MPTNQHGPYFPGGNTGGEVDSPNKKFQPDDEPTSTGPEHLASRTIDIGTIDIDDFQKRRKYYLDKMRSPTLAEESQVYFDSTKTNLVSGKISIIMPTYRRQHIIQKAVNSIIKQSYTNWELILVDNEPEHTYSFSDSRIRYFNHSERPSASHARNKGIEYITGEFVCFFDDDDTMDPDYLKIMITPFGDPEIHITHCEVWLAENRVNQSFCTPSSMVRRHLVTSTWRDDNFGHDQLFWLGILKRIQPHSLVGIKAILVYCGTSQEGGMRGGGKL